jgi:hypothetical protein
MALRLVSLLVSLVIMGVLASNVRTRLHATTKTGPATPQSLLRTTATVVEHTRQITGEYTGVGLQDGSAMRLASADANGYCLELTWVDRAVYHLRGPGGQPLKGAC